MEELIEFLISRMNEEELEKLYDKLVGDEDEDFDVDCNGDCNNCNLIDECFEEYCNSHEDCADCDSFYTCFEEVYGHKFTIADEIKDVKFNGPATIVFWLDGTKTVSVCSDEDIYDPEKGLAMCILKKLLGNSDYNEAFKRFIPDEVYEEKFTEDDKAVADAFEVVEELLQTKKLTETQRDAIKLLLDLD